MSETGYSASDHLTPRKGPSCSHKETIAKGDISPPFPRSAARSQYSSRSTLPSHAKKLPPIPGWVLLLPLLLGFMCLYRLGLVPGSGVVYCESGAEGNTISLSLLLLSFSVPCLACPSGAKCSEGRALCLKPDHYPTPKGCYPSERVWKDLDTLWHNIAAFLEVENGKHSCGEGGQGPMTIADLKKHGYPISRFHKNYELLFDAGIKEILDSPQGAYGITYDAHAVKDSEEVSVLLRAVVPQTSIRCQVWRMFVSILPRLIFLAIGGGMVLYGANELMAWADQGKKVGAATRKAQK